MNVKLRGFSLIETAIVVLIVGILLGAGIRSCLSGIDTAKMDNTRDKLSNLKVLIMRNFCKTGNLLNGTEIPPQYLKDAWNDDIKLIYASDTNGTKLCSMDNTTLSVILPSGKEVKDVVAVILSPSVDRVLDSNLTSNPIEIKNDDLWRRITLDEIKGQCCKNVTILTPSLPPIVEGASYNVDFVVTGGKPPYQCEITSDNSTVENFFKNHLVQGNADSPYCRVIISANDSKDFVSSLSSNEISINLKVSDSSNPSFLNLKNYLITLVRRDL